MEAKSLIPAAQYLRMSTGRQACSLQIQVEAINLYAQLHGFEIINTYSDAGRSGINLRNRPELIRLLDDVITGKACFKTVLVFDVSRWGRFQDCDEAAHYEFLCKRAGVPVHYCAESFANDNSLSSSVIKALKRTMAAEYSREMGERVFAGSKRLAQLGYKQGGTAGFGLRRLLVSAEGKHKEILAKGELKNVRTDRVILVPGPREEVATVHEIYRLLLEDNETPYRIMRELNLRKVPSPNGEWRLTTILRILTDPKYAGFNVWNRSSRRLGSNAVSVSKPQWTLQRGAFEPLIEPHLFQRTQSVLAAQREPYSTQDLLEMLRCLMEEKGTVSWQLLKESKEVPSEHTFIKHFGTLRRAFELAGKSYQKIEPTLQQSLHAKQSRDLLLKELIILFPSQVALIATGDSEKHLMVDNTLRIGVVVCPPVRHGKHLNWIVDQSCLKGTSLALLARLEPDQSHIRDFLLLKTPRFRLVRRISELPNHRLFGDISEFYSAMQSLLLEL